MTDKLICPICQSLLMKDYQTSYTSYSCPKMEKFRFNSYMTHYHLALFPDGKKEEWVHAAPFQAIILAKTTLVRVEVTNNPTSRPLFEYLLSLPGRDELNDIPKMIARLKNLKAFL